VRASALAQTHETVLNARSISEFARVNRVEGLALGLGLGRQLGAGIFSRVYGRFGFADHEPKGDFVLGWQRPDASGVQLRLFRSFRDVGDEPEVSLLRNTIAAQELGSDYTDPYDTRGGSVTLDLGNHAGGRWRLSGGYEWQDRLEVHATPAWGHYEPTIAAWKLHGPRGELSFERPTALSLGGFEVRIAGEAHAARASLDIAGRDGDETTFGRGWLGIQSERPVGGGRVVLRTSVGGGVGPDLPPQEFVYLGGPITAPGYGFHELVGRFGASQRVEARFSVPFPALSLGRYGNTGRSVTLAPYAHTAYLARVENAGPAVRGPGWYPALGVGVLTVFDLLRFDVAKGLRDGRWSFSVDVIRDFWSIL
jgi:hypothetical protein